jgi:cell fate (sporulation/competence/biofilm development) regulator YmcA (YheA/YmcA/DUF963 family)
MVIFVKPNGETIAENQLLSVGAHSGRISIVAPSRPGAFVEMLVKTPTGELLEPIYAAPVLSISAEDIGLYTCGIVPRMTSAAGRVEYQLSFAYEGGEKEVTPMGTFVVQPGNIVLPPDEPTKSMYEEIKQAMISASANYVDVFLRIEKALESANSVEINLEKIETARAEAVLASDLAQESANKVMVDMDAVSMYATRAETAAKNAQDVFESMTDMQDPQRPVNAHNADTSAHSDIRAQLSRLSALLNSDDITLDQTKEIVEYIKSNRSLIEQITTGKVSVSDIVNDLVTNNASKPLSAAQGVKLKQMIDDITNGESTAVKYTSQSLTNSQKAQVRTNIGAAPAYTYGTEDIEAGTASPHPNGTLHFVYEPAG